MGPMDVTMRDAWGPILEGSGSITLTLRQEQEQHFQGELISLTRIY